MHYPGKGVRRKPNAEANIWPKAGRARNIGTYIDRLSSMYAARMFRLHTKYYPQWQPKHVVPA